MVQPRNLTAYYPNDSTAISLDGSNNVILWADRSGNSATNVLVLNGATSNNASFSALTAFGTADFTVSAQVTPTSLAALGYFFGDSNNTFGLKLNTNGTLQSSLVSIADNTASSGTLSALVNSVVAYVRSGTTGTYYINGVSAGTTTDSRNYSVGQSNLTRPANALAVNLFWSRIYSVALDAAGVLADANGAVQANCVFNVNFSLVPKLAASFTAVTGGTVTINTSGDTGARISGERDLYQGTAANRPAYTAATGAGTGQNRLFMTFDGTNDYLKSALFPLSQPETVYLVTRQITWTSNDYFYDGGTGLTMVLAQASPGSSPQIQSYAGTAGPVSTAFAVGTIGVVAAVYNGVNSPLRVNRNLTAAANVGTNTPNGFTLGCDGAATTNFVNASISEIAIYSEAHTTPVQNSIINYLASKFGVPL